MTLLVGEGTVKEGLGGHRGGGGQPVAPHGVDDLLRRPVGAPSEARARAGHEAHARRDAGAVSEPVLARRLDRMADGVAQVEGLSDAAFALVRVDHVALDLDAAGDHLCEAIEGELALVDRRSGERLEEVGVAHHAVLEHLSAGVGEEMPVDGGEAVEVRDDRARLEEGAREILARPEVDPRLAADRRVDHRE